MYSMSEGEKLAGKVRLQRGPGGIVSEEEAVILNRVVREDCLEE